MQVAKDILQPLERFDHRAAVANQIRYRLRDVAEILRRNARTMQLLDVRETVDGGELGSQLLALLEQAFSENRPEPRSAVRLAHWSAVGIQSTRDLGNRRREVRGGSERDVDPAASLRFQPLAQPGLSDPLPCAERRPLLAQPLEVHAGVASRPRCVGEPGKTRPLL